MAVYRSAAILATFVMLGTTGCAADVSTGVTSCSPAESITLPGSPLRIIGGSCGAYLGFTAADKAPTYPLHLGEVVRLAHFHERPESSAPAVAQVGLDQALSHGRSIIWTLKATALGVTTLYDHVGVCGHGGVATKCALANFKVIK